MILIIRETGSMNNYSDRKNNFIDVLKGVCIIFVLITHFSWTDSERVKYLFSFWIETAVPIFMIISGYVYAYSYRRHGITCLSEAYLPANIVNKIIRYTFPFFITYLLELAYLFIISNKTLTADNYLDWIFCFFQGGIGHGSYYYPIMIQFIFVYPIIYFIIHKDSQKGLIICFFINAMYEFLQRAYGMGGDLYRLLIFRYIFVIAAGCYMASDAPKLKLRTGFVSFLIGFIYLISITFFGYSPKIIVYWNTTSFMAGLYIVPIVFFLITKVKNCHFMPLEIIGKASYNIFLTQMVWFGLTAWYLEKFIVNRALLLGMDLLICIGVGVIFYYIETPITKRIIKKIYSVFF